MPPKKTEKKAAAKATAKAPAKAPAKPRGKTAAKAAAKAPGKGGKRRVVESSESEASDSETSAFESQDSAFESGMEADLQSEADEFVEDAEPLELEEKKLEVYDPTDEEPETADPDEFNSRSERVEERRSIPVLTRYERTRIIGARAAQLARGAKPLVRGSESLDPQQIAELELREGVSPFYIKRPLPNNRYEVFHVSELELLD